MKWCIKSQLMITKSSTETFQRKGGVYLGRSIYYGLYDISSYRVWLHRCLRIIKTQKKNVCANVLRRSFPWKSGARLLYAPGSNKWRWKKQDEKKKKEGNKGWRRKAMKVKPCFFIFGLLSGQTKQNEKQEKDILLAFDHCAGQFVENKFRDGYDIKKTKKLIIPHWWIVDYKLIPLQYVLWSRDKAVCTCKQWKKMELLDLFMPRKPANNLFDWLIAFSQLVFAGL